MNVNYINIVITNIVITNVDMSAQIGTPFYKVVYEYNYPRVITWNCTPEQRKVIIQHVEYEHYIRSVLSNREPRYDDLPSLNDPSGPKLRSRL